MTIWALALLAVTARAANVAPRASAPSGGGAQVRAVPTVTPSLGGGIGGISLGNLGLSGTIPALPSPIPGLTQGLPAAYFVPPGALGYKKVEAQTAAAAPATLGDAAPAHSPAPLVAPTARGQAARRGGLIPEQPTGALSTGLLPAEGRDKTAAGLMPALGASGAAALPSDAAAADEAVVGSGRGVFDNAASKPSVDISGFGIPSRPEMSALNPGLSPSGPRAEGARSSVPGPYRGEAASGSPNAVPESDYLPASSYDAIRSPIPGAVSVAGDMRDALASPRPLDLAGAGVLGGHAPLLARPSRLALAGEGLVVRVGPAPDATFKGRGEFSPTPAPPASRAEAARRLISTELIERGALLEAVAVADAAVGRGLLGLPDGDVPGAMTGALKLKDAPAAPSRPAPPRPVSGDEKALGLLGLSLLPLAAFLAARRFL